MISMCCDGCTVTIDRDFIVERISLKISVQSMIILVVGYSVNCSGMSFWVRSWNGKENNSGRNRTFCQVVKSLEACPIEIPNQL